VADPKAELEVLHRAGMIGQPAIAAAQLLWRAAVGTAAASVEPSGRPVVVAVCRESARERLGVVFWRRHGTHAWTDDDVTLADAAAGIVWLLMARTVSERCGFIATPNDTLTQLLGQRTFVAEAMRHLARLDREDVPGTLMLAEVDNLESVRERFGPDAANQVLRRAAVLLRGTVRPTDLVGRTGDAEFAVWLSGADYMTAAERAENLCAEAPNRDPASDSSSASEVRFSIGIATRQAGESFADLAGRAGQAMRQVKREGGGYWRVSLSKAA
jgi:diguanylate cyclase (GGDEF)-like protein